MVQPSSTFIHQSRIVNVFKSAAGTVFSLKLADRNIIPSAFERRKYQIKGYRFQHSDIFFNVFQLKNGHIIGVQLISVH